MNKDQIYQLLNERNLNASMIARSLNVSPAAVQRVISEGGGSERIANAIATMCEKPLFQLFPYYEKKQKEQQDRKRLQDGLDAKLAKFA